MSLYSKLFSHLKKNSDIDSNLLTLLPRSYKRVGHIALINLDDRLLIYKTEIGEAMLLFLSSSIQTIARFTKPIKGMERKPSIEVIAGNSSLDTIHIEHNTKFFLNPAKLMLSAGNHNERKRIIDFISSLENKNLVVLDMFACVGNLSLPVANYIKKCRVIALEINPLAIKYLKKSLELNKLPEDKYKVILGDNRQITPQNIADIVIMGYFQIDELQLEKAIQALNTRKDQCWLMVHDTGSANSDSIVIEKLKSKIESNKHWELKSIEKHIIKSIGPRFEHWVFDCCIQHKTMMNSLEELSEE
jgi:tRNA G37 N-methylase Trm5